MRSCLQIGFVLLTKKLECLSDIQASPKLISWVLSLVLISKLYGVCSIGFLKVLPLVFILDG